jgi:hypothetical protein
MAVCDRPGAEGGKAMKENESTPDFFPATQKEKTDAPLAGADGITRDWQTRLRSIREGPSRVVFAAVLILFGIYELFITIIYLLTDLLPPPEGWLTHILQVHLCVGFLAMLAGCVAYFIVRFQRSILLSRQGLPRLEHTQGVSSETKSAQAPQDRIMTHPPPFTAERAHPQ